MKDKARKKGSAAAGDTGMDEELGARLRRSLDRQRAAFRAEGFPSAARRIDRLDRATAMVLENERAIVEAMSKDFGHRSRHYSALADVAAPVSAFRYAKRRVKQWMRPEPRKVEPPMKLLAVKAWVEFQPLGVVGIISPWNVPFALSMIPLADALAAGNRVMIKPSELTPATSEILAEIVGATFDETEVAVFPGGAEVGAAFSSLPFDHLMFTGSTRVGRLVLKAAAENLVPVTLELGGKCPVVVSRSANPRLAAARIAMAKIQNAGQVCMSPDYLLVPRESAGALAELVKAKLAAMLPTLVDNPDYTAIINESHYRRVMEYVDDARARGARVEEVNPAGETFDGQRHRKIPPTLIFDVTEEMLVMQEEIFGPLLPVLTYDRIDEAIDYVNDHPRPLALYYFGTDAAEKEKVLRETVSGGVNVNDAAMHFNVHDLPFGGVGPSGMGSYRGVNGFRTFSSAKGVCEHPHLDMPNPAEPPYGTTIEILTRLWRL